MRSAVARVLQMTLLSVDLKQNEDQMVVDIRDKQSDPEDRVPAARDPQADSWKSRPDESVPPAPKFSLQQPPPAEIATPATARGETSPAATDFSAAFDAADLSGDILESEPVTLPPSPLKHADTDAMFGAVTRGLIQVERRKTLGVRMRRLTLALVFLTVAGAAAYAVWHYQQDWVLQWWPADWAGDVFDRDWWSELTQSLT